MRRFGRPRRSRHGPERAGAPRKATRGWRSAYKAVVASDISDRDGLGWEFTDARTGDPAWAVFREDGGPFPVFSGARGEGALPPLELLEAMTLEAVSDLLSAAGLTDEIGWITRNIAAALLLAACDVVSWEGEEWSLESEEEGDAATAWAEPGNERVPFAWLRARCASSSAVLVGIYQDDALFGLSFIDSVDRELPGHDLGSLRARRDIDLVRGPIGAVEVVYDTTVEGTECPGLITEALLHGEGGSTLLIAAEAYSRDKWHLYDESVVAVRDASTADILEWIPPRTSWRPTEGPR